MRHNDNCKKKKRHTKEPTPKHQASPLLYSIEIKDVNAAVPGILQPQYISMELGGGRAKEKHSKLQKWFKNKGWK